jgi:hypothetical protein
MKKFSAIVHPPERPTPTQVEYCNDHILCVNAFIHKDKCMYMKNKEKMTLEQTPTPKLFEDMFDYIKDKGISETLEHNGNPPMPFPAPQMPPETPFVFDSPEASSPPRKARVYPNKGKRGSPHTGTIRQCNELLPDASEDKYKIVHSSIKLQTLEQLNKIIKTKKTNMNNIIRTALLSYIIQHEDDRE